MNLPVRIAGIREPIDGYAGLGSVEGLSHPIRLTISAALQYNYLKFVKIFTGHLSLGVKDKYLSLDDRHSLNI